ncbi:MAG: hypothetical protein B7X99_19645 [Rhizobiales bacterium 17-65-6]|nr:MAG: hypothetical protein B7X99_19645 [Rhizobiales bacterium 17-65-6]
MMLEIITADVLLPRHGFFTRKGGASSGIFAGLNCGPGSTDQAEAVAINRGRVAEALDLPPDHLVSVHQVHSATVVPVTAAFADDDRHLTLIIQLRAFRRADQRLVVSGERARKAREQRHIGRVILAILIFRIAIREINTDAKNLFRLGNRDFVSNLRHRKVSTPPGGQIRNTRQRAVFDHFAQTRPLRSMTR